MYESQRMRQKWFSVFGDEPEQSEEEQDSLKVSLASWIKSLCSVYGVYVINIVLNSVSAALGQDLVCITVLCSLDVSLGHSFFTCRWKREKGAKA